MNVRVRSQRHGPGLRASICEPRAVASCGSLGLLGHVRQGLSPVGGEGFPGHVLTSSQAQEITEASPCSGVFYILFPVLELAKNLKKDIASFYVYRETIFC